ncbi:response regulator transcription factor [Nostoc sp. 'Lobaria pulmonaria (5183) cyanobiont']|uniref:response regulator transcription factor n=1 Tax=Nostoc sp. 'Lobaria pulmonaria (5183) cyanobiont' TaxID=1618022 RepID=UPI000CF30E79|nr:response regulator [Nostoc sp. 'Lobaria pulmonaria (5183) cyanobiont']AVH70660.1 AraC family two component transcriptional regulator [Nostoc sp. 'Lobaria pulmonaria (5183) cyanobiont']
MSESSKKILVIEDDNVTRNLYLKGLEAKGFDTIGAANGLAGIQQAQEHIPDLVICDITMPDMDGYSVLATLRQAPVTAIIPFIFLTGSSTRADVRKAMELGADDHLSKPSTIDELLRAIAIRLQKQATLQYWCTIQFQKAAKSLFADNTTAIAGRVAVGVGVGVGDREGVATLGASASGREASGREAMIPHLSIFPCIPQLKEVFDFIEAHYDQGITLCDVAVAVGYSPAYLTNRVAKQTGETVNCWIVKRRMAGARFLLQNNDQTVEKIAKALGYQDVSHFSRQFRQHHGLPPQAWRKEHQLVSQKQATLW